MRRDDALKVLGTLNAHQREAIATIAETQEGETDYVGGYDDDGSICVDDVQATLSTLARLFRETKVVSP